MPKTMTIYDYDDTPVEIELPDKDISIIRVTVLSGDETEVVLFEDGSALGFDASDCRFHDFYDGCYAVYGPMIEKWMQFTPPEGDTVSYARMNAVADWKEESDNAT